MKLIVITSPSFLNDEIDSINALFQSGLEILHLRKPHSSKDEVETLLQSISPSFHNRIIVHEHFELVEQYGLKGVHLNGRNPVAPQGYKGHISCSCHSLREAEERKLGCDYLFLSPIFDSISKEGYGAAYTAEDLKAAQQCGIIDDRVIALGGVCSDNIPQIKAFGFGGAALLGDVWGRQGEDFICHFKQLLQIIHS